MKKDEKSTLDKLIGLVKPKKKHYYKLFIVKNGVENLVEEREIDGDADNEMRIVFMDYRKKEAAQGGQNGGIDIP